MPANWNDSPKEFYSFKFLCLRRPTPQDPGLFNAPRLSVQEGPDVAILERLAATHAQRVPDRQNGTGTFFLPADKVGAFAADLAAQADGFAGLDIRRAHALLTQAAQDRCDVFLSEDIG